MTNQNNDITQAMDKGDQLTVINMLLWHVVDMCGGSLMVPGAFKSRRVPNERLNNRGLDYRPVTRIEQCEKTGDLIITAAKEPLKGNGIAG